LGEQPRTATSPIRLPHERGINTHGAGTSKKQRLCNVTYSLPSYVIQNGRLLDGALCEARLSRDLLLFVATGTAILSSCRSVTTGRWIMGDGLTVVMGRVSAEEDRRREDKGHMQNRHSNKMGDIAVPEECHPEKEQQRWNMEHLNISISTILLLFLHLDLLFQPFQVWGSSTEKSHRMLAVQYLVDTRTIKVQYCII
jgi:hypothetical protein